MANDPYAHRKHRAKYQLGYGAEGAARGEHDMHPDMKMSPKDESFESQPKEHGKEAGWESAPGQMSKKNAKSYKRS